MLNPSVTPVRAPDLATDGWYLKSGLCIKKSPAPLFHTAGRRAYLELREAYSRFVAAFRDAAEKLRAGDRLVSFPEGSFPPALPFVQPATAG